MTISKTKRHILIVGGLAAGPSAAAKAIRINPNAEVILFESGDSVSYGICEAPYAISGLIRDEEKLVVFKPEQLSHEKGIQVKTLHHVERILPSKHKIIVRDLSNQTTSEYAYDKLILATGAIPRRLNVEGENGRNVFYLRSRDDTRNIINYIKAETPKRVSIIGAGYIGLEMAEALSQKGLDITIIQQHNLPLSSYEQITREQVLNELVKNNVQLKLNAHTESLLQNKDSRVYYVLTDKGPIEADLVIVAIGAIPNVVLANSAKIRLGKTGAIAVNEFQQTSADDIYSAGDCCEIKNIVSGQPMYLPLATYASRAGRVAGENAAGGRAVFRGGIRAVALKIFEMEIAQVGLSSAEATEAGFQVCTDTITADEKVPFMPDNQKTTITLILDRKSKRLLGANIFGKTGVALRGNTLGLAIQHKLKIDDICNLDLIYAPPFSPLWDPILIAGNHARNKL
jgi:NADPH-dependent 2,4-dienoyl-CoA reductase/sulfur reductase-like enzyme